MAYNLSREHGSKKIGLGNVDLLVVNKMGYEQ
jgi:hypothetical protein